MEYAKEIPRSDELPYLSASAPNKEIVMNKLAFGLFRRLGLDVRRVRRHPSLNDFLAHRNVQVLYDVGANIGQFGSKVRQRGYTGKIVSFEPVSSVFDELKRVAERDGNWDIGHYAIGAKTGETTINISRNTQFSSLKPLAQRSSAIDPDSSFAASETVEVKTLDELVKPTGSAYFIKIDTQGFEREVLDGGKTAIAGAAGVVMELPVINTYEDTWTFHEAIDHMRGLGFILCQIDPVGHHQADPMAVIDFDCLFRQKTTGVD
jgi:FkbM family methyltransferase